MFKSRIEKNAIKSSEYYGEGSIELSILLARLRHQYSSDLLHLNITNDSK